jgi:hypothetical protein
LGFTAEQGRPILNQKDPVMDHRPVGGFVRQSVSLLLTCGMISASLPASAWWGRDDNPDPYQQNNNRYNNQQSSYQPAYKQPDIKVAAPKVDIKPINQEFFKVPEGRLTDEDRQLIGASNALNPPKVPDSYLNPSKSITAPKTNLTNTPLTLQFKPPVAAADAKAPKAQEINRNVLKDAPTTAVKNPVLEGFQKVFRAVGEVFAGAGRKIAQAIQAVAHFFRGKPSTEPSPLAKQLSQEYAHLKEIHPGVFQTTKEGQTYAHGMAWEPGSTFKATPNGIQLVKGVTMDTSVAGLSKENGGLLPIVMRGKPEGGVEPVGLDFTRMTPGTSLKASSPVDIPNVGTIHANKITYTGQKNGDPVLEINGKGALSVESISDPKIINQATEQLSIRLRLMDGSFQAKDAVLTVGGEKTYLDAQGKATPVSSIEKGVLAATVEAAPMVTGAKKLATAEENNGRAAVAQIDNILGRTGQVPEGALAPTDEAARLKATAEGFSRQASAAKADLAGENYGEVLTALPSLKEQGAALQAEQSLLTTKSEALRGFSKSLCGLSADLTTLVPQVNQDGIMSGTPTLDQMADNARRYFPEEKGAINAKTRQALVQLTALVDGGVLDPGVGAAWGKGLVAAHDRLMMATPNTVGYHAKEVGGAFLNRPISGTKELLDFGMQRQIFDGWEKMADTNPKATLAFARVGLGASWIIAGASAVVWAKEAGILMLGKPLLALGAYGAGKLTGYGLERAGVEKEGAEFWGNILGGLGFGVTAGRAGVLQASPSWARTAGTWLEGNFSGVMGKEVGNLGIMEKPIGQLFTKEAVPVAGNQFAHLTDEQLARAMEERVGGKIVSLKRVGGFEAVRATGGKAVLDALLDMNPVKNRITDASREEAISGAIQWTPSTTGALQKAISWTIGFMTMPLRPARLIYGW